MRHPISAIALLALVSAQTAMATAAEAERLVSPPLTGFVVGYSAANETQSIREEVPRGETVERWTRMVTTQRFAGLAARSTPAAYARTIAEQTPRACPGAKVSPLTSLIVSTRAAARLQVDCPRSEGGVSESFLLLAVAGRSDMHVRQVAFRGAKTQADLAWAERYLGATVLCGQGDRQASCR